MKLILLAAALLGLLTGCGAGGEEIPAPTGETLVFNDDLGREIVLEKLERVAALTGSFADLWCLAGGGDTLVAAAGDAWTSFDLVLSGDVTDLGAIKTPNVELLLAARPDLVLASSNTAAQVDLLPLLEGAGLQVAYFHVTTFGEYLNMLDICTGLTGDREAYDTYGTEQAAQVQRAKARADGVSPTVLYIRATGSSCKVKNSRDTVLGEMLADLGCVNVADREGELLEQLSLEAIIRADPDYIFAVLQGAEPEEAERTLEGTLLSNPAWSGLRAVEEGRFYVLDHRLYNLKPNARWGEAYENLSEILYPRG